MKPVTVSVDVDTPRDEVFDFLDVMANHEQFTDHFMVDWELSGPPRGVGAKANLRVKATGEKDRTDIEVVEVDAGRRIVEEGTGGTRGRRRTRGTYLLEDLPGGGTRIEFTLEFLSLPTGEKLMGPLQRAYLKRVNGKSLKRLSERLSST
ncbi:MAG TPA: SRPBCC family protein [Solirubrobacterales bacterium]|nr:SRPBCC family protein [Solirubrobacterales bacterium]